jgi:hypothetical protein
MNQASTRTNSTVSPRSVLAVLGASKILFFVAAGLSFLLSIWLWFSGDRERGLFVGLWVPSILSAGGLLLNRSHHE